MTLAHLNRTRARQGSAALTLLLLPLLARPASAAEPDTYPMMATVNLPAGAAAMMLPADVVAGDSDALAQTLRLQDASGAEVPFAILTSRNSSEGETKYLSWEPMSAPQDGTLETGAWLIGETDVPLDGLKLRMDDFERGPWIARIYMGGSAEDPGWVQVGEEQFLYALHGSDGSTNTRDQIKLPHRRGPFKVVLSGMQAPTITAMDGIVYAGDHVEPVTEEVTVSGPVYTESGAARYTIQLPGPRAVTGLNLHVTEPIFSRSLSVSTGAEDGSYPAVYPIARAMVGQDTLDETSVNGLTFTSDRLVLEIADGRDQALTITGATVESVGALLLTPASGAAPQTLYFGGTEPDSASDVAIAADEIARIAHRYEGEALKPEPNPAFVARPTREGLDGAGAPVNLALWKWERPIDADPGWTRILVDGSVLLHARPDLADLRVVDKEGHSLPFDLRPASAEVEVPLGEMKRVENGEASELTLSMPPDVGMIRRIELETDATTFSRAVDVVRDRGTFSQALRSVEWVGNGAPQRLTLELNEELGAALMLRVHNGDDPPLPVTAVHAWTRGNELRVNVPEGGARLVYGNRRASAPEFDLSLISGQLGRVPMHAGTLGDERAGGGVTMSVIDEGLVAVGLGALAVGLLALGIGALRPVKAPEPAPAGAAGAGATGGSPGGSAGSGAAGAAGSGTSGAGTSGSGAAGSSSAGSAAPNGPGSDPNAP